jgi:hypothetical protein
MGGAASGEPTHQRRVQDAEARASSKDLSVFSGVLRDECGRFEQLNLELT